MLENHLRNVSAAVEAACERARGKPLAEMVKDVVEAFVDTKMERSDISTALYRIAADVGGPTLVKRMGQRSQADEVEELAHGRRGARADLRDHVAGAQ